MNKQIIVIGAGAAGLTAAFFAASRGNLVTVLERTKICGKKILISGGSRCNVLPVAFSPDDYFTSSSRNTMKNILRSWNVKDCLQWFERVIGLKMVTEKDSAKWFPASNSAKEVRDLLLKKVINAGGKIIYNAGVEKIEKIDDQWLCHSFEGNIYRADRLIVATGGLSFPQMGTDGKGHRFLQELGHKIKKVFPALTPLKGKHPGNQQLAGISLNVSLTVRTAEKKKIKAERSGFVFTHKGYSGPAILDLAHYAIIPSEKNEERPIFSVNWNNYSEEQWQEILAVGGKGLLLNKLKEHLPSRLAEAICLEAGLTERKLAELKKTERNQLLELLIRYPLPYNGSEGYAKAEVTGGGVALEEINPETMESKLFPGLFLCGEILDTFGRIGGFNFYWAWVTGRLAGLAV